LALAPFFFYLILAKLLSLWFIYANANANWKHETRTKNEKQKTGLDKMSYFFAKNCSRRPRSRSAQPAALQMHNSAELDLSLA
jgi:hypothetical protein